MEIHPRGPETFSLHHILENIYLGFHRLAIHGLTSLVNQPFIKQVSPTKSIWFQTIILWPRRKCLILWGDTRF